MRITRSQIIEPLLLLAFDDHADEAENVVEIPEDLSTLSNEELAELREQASTAFDAIHDADELSAEDLVSLTELAEGIELIDTETTAREERAAAARAQADELAQRVHGAPDEADTEASTSGEDGEGEDDAEDDDDSENEDGEEDDDGEGDDDAEPGAADGVTASARPAARRRRVSVPVGRLSGHAPDPEVGANGEQLVVITAAADLPGLSPGARMDTTRVAQAMHDRARHLGEGHSAPIASISIPSQGRVTREMDKVAQDAAMVAAATLPGDGSAEALVAAGGWCAPSQTLYDLFGIEGRDGIVDMPTLTVERGGLEFIENGGPSFGDVSAHPWLWTEAMDIDALDNDGTPETDVLKPCVRVPCPVWTEERLDASGICITHGNLADRAMPEMTRRFVDLVVAADLHVRNGRRIAAMEAESDAAAVGLGPAMGTLSPVLDALEWQIVDYRDKYRMPLNSVLETVFPHWLRSVLRADYGRRNGIDNPSVADAALNAWIVARGARPQWVYDWQSLSRAGTTAAAVPANVKFLLYAAGTFVNGTGGSLDLGVARDARLNETNDHTVAFTESFDLVAKRGHESRVLTVGLDPDGTTGAQLVAA